MNAPVAETRWPRPLRLLVCLLSIALAWVVVVLVGSLVYALAKSPGAAWFAMGAGFGVYTSCAFLLCFEPGRPPAGHDAPMPQARP